MSANASGQVIALEHSITGAADRLRASLWGRLGRVESLARLARDRPTRLLLVASLSVVAAFAGATAIPLVLLVAGPLLLGVPHLASDVRYLWRELPSRKALLFFLAGTVVFAALGMLRAQLACGVIAVLLVRRRIWILGVLALALAFPSQFAIALLHGHNLVAIGIAAWLARGRVRAPWLPIGLFVAGAAAICLIDPQIAAPRWIHVGSGRWLVLFAYAQAVHYAAWLRIVPDAQRSGPRTVGYRRSWRSLVSDLGRSGARLAVLLSVVVPLAALISVRQAHAGYFVLASFHAWLELAWLNVKTEARAMG